MQDATNETDEGRGRPFADGRIMVVALRGWNDAGEAASAAVDELAQALTITERVETIDDEAYFDYSINRPQSVRTSRGDRRILWPHVEVLQPASADDLADADDVAAPGEVPMFDLAAGGLAAEGGAATTANLASDADMRVTAANGRNLVMLVGHEPTLKWRAFAARVLEVCDELEVTRLVLVGALLADVPHTRPIGVFVSSEDSAFRVELSIGRSEYEGPTGVLGVLSHEAAARGIPSVSVWASVPHYTNQPPSPKAALAIIDKLEELLDVTIPRAALLERAENWERGVNEAMTEDSDIAEYISYLERAHDTASAPEASGEAIAKEFERFLRQSGEPGRPPGVAQAGGWTGPIAKPGAEPWATPDERGGADDASSDGPGPADGQGPASE